MSKPCDCCRRARAPCRSTRRHTARPSNAVNKYDERPETAGADAGEGPTARRRVLLVTHSDNTLLWRSPQRAHARRVFFCYRPNTQTTRARREDVREKNVQAAGVSGGEQPKTTEREREKKNNRRGIKARQKVRATEGRNTAILVLVDTRMRFNIYNSFLLLTRSSAPYSSFSSGTSSALHKSAVTLVLPEEKRERGGKKQK